MTTTLLLPAPHTVLVRRCAWCGRDMGQREGIGISGQSDGMCPACAIQFLADAGIEEVRDDRAAAGVRRERGDGRDGGPRAGGLLRGRRASGQAG